MSECTCSTMRREHSDFYCPSCFGSVVKDIKKLEQDNEALTKKLQLIASMCGNPDPAEACRLIIKEVQG